jgi:hypothetical protein
MDRFRDKADGAVLPVEQRERSARKRFSPAALPIFFYSVSAYTGSQRPVSKSFRNATEDLSLDTCLENRSIMEKSCARTSPRIIGTFLFG